MQKKKKKKGNTSKVLGSLLPGVRRLSSSSNVEAIELAPIYMVRRAARFLTNALS